jgi:hypothetical protein
MNKHGKHYYCPGHWSTNITGRGGYHHTFAALSLKHTNWSRMPRDRSAYPWCLRCKVRMRHEGPRYSCRNCGNMARARVTIKGKIDFKERQIISLLNQGYSQKYVAQKLHTHHCTVARLNKFAKPKLCPCGLLFFHKKKCRQRKWTDAISNHRSLFDDLVVRVGRKINLPPEEKAEVAQMVFLRIVERIEQTINEVPQFIRAYRRLYPQGSHTEIDKLAHLRAG